MTSIIYNENVTNNENALYNMDLLDNKQMNKGKNYPKIYQKQTTKGLTVQDQNVLHGKNPEKDAKDHKLNKVPIQKNNVIPTELNLLPSPIQFDIDQEPKDDDIILSPPNFNLNEKEMK